ncbi:MAG: SDR family NAD(P)-dependent oxidoreductase [Bacteroidetes bacterium]|nr:MAG: SDR family NAD(P)-dependent oxidoreductase [Bacteroidota bacterium]
MTIRDRTVLVTGATSGVGRALAEAFADQGARVVAHGRDTARLAAVVAAVEGTPVVVDLADPAGAFRLVSDTLAATERAGWAAPSIVVNNAAVQMNYFFGERGASRAAEDAAREVALDLTVPIQTTVLLLPTLREAARHSGVPSIVVNVTSGLALAPKKSAPIYCAAKSGLRTFSKALRYQMEDEAAPGDSNVRVVEAMLPLVDTPMTAGRETRVAKMSAKQAAHEILEGIIAGRDEIGVGKARVFRHLHRWMPMVAERMLRDG